MSSCVSTRCWPTGSLSGSILTFGAIAPVSGEPHEGEVLLLGPAEAPIAMLRGRHRFRLAVKASRNADLQGFLRAVLAAAPPARGGVRVAVDVDPQSFM